MKKKWLICLLLAAGYAANSFAQNTTVHLNHVAIFVIDVQKSTTFYTRIIGLDTLPEPFHDGKHTWLNIGPHQAMHIIQGAAAVKEYYKNNHFCFTVPSVENFTALLSKNNIAWEDRDGAKKAITTRIDGVKQIWLQDPDGYWVEINDAKD